MVPSKAGHDDRRRRVRQSTRRNVPFAPRRSNCVPDSSAPEDRTRRRGGDCGICFEIYAIGRVVSHHTKPVDNAVRRIHDEDADRVVRDIDVGQSPGRRRTHRAETEVTCHRAQLMEFRLREFGHLRILCFTWVANGRRRTHVHPDVSIEKALSDRS